MTQIIKYKEFLNTEDFEKWQEETQGVTIYTASPIINYVDAANVLLKQHVINGIFVTYTLQES